MKKSGDKEESYLQRDERWGAFSEISMDYTYFKSIVADQLYLSNAAPEDIQKAFRVIRRLVEFSFFEYEFYDVAVSKMLVLLELAMKLEFRKDEKMQNKGKTQKVDFKTLMEWARIKNRFETDSKAYCDWIQGNRNSYTHPVHYWYAGRSLENHLLGTLDLINDLYEDVALRLERKKIWAGLSDKLKQLVENGGCVQCNNKMEAVVYELRPGFINNKNSPMVITVLGQAVFEVPENFEPGQPIGRRAAHYWTLHNIDFSGDVITGIDADGNKIQIESLQTTDYIEGFQKWKAGFDLYNSAGGKFLTHIADIEMAQVSTGLRSAFHRIYLES